MQKARGRPEGLPQSADGWFQVLFHSPSGVLFTFPSRYLCAIGRQPVFSLGGWAPRIRAGFHVSRPTWDPGGTGHGFAHGAVTLCGAPFQRLALAGPGPCAGPATPADESAGLGYSAFARRYSRNHCCSPLLRVLRCFTSPGLASRPYVFRAGWRPSTGRRIAPFGNPRIKGRMRLPAAYRSLPRPSSPAAAKASAIRPSSLAAKFRPWRTRRSAGRAVARASMNPGLRSLASPARLGTEIPARAAVSLAVARGQGGPLPFLFFFTDSFSRYPVAKEQTPSRCQNRFLAEASCNHLSNPSTPNERPINLRDLMARKNAFGGERFVEPKGLEPTTSCLQSRRSTN